MVNREIIRLKVLQLTYAFFQNPNKDLSSAERELFVSLSQSYNLYLYLLGIIPDLLKVGRHAFEIETLRAEREHLPAPSSKFIDNRFALQLESNFTLQQFRANESNTWMLNEEFLKKLYSQIINSEICSNYLNNPDDSYEADREFWRKIYKTLLMENPDIDAILEDKNIFWNDDKEVIDTFVMKTIRRFDEANGDKQELLPNELAEEDREFARLLFLNAVTKAEEYHTLMMNASKNWNFTRMAYMDIIIMQLAIAEMLTFPNIPLNVTINVYVDLAKLYSTSKSGKFVNGMLDKIARNLIERKKMLKQMKEPIQ